MPLGAAAALRSEAMRLVEDIELFILIEDQVAKEPRILRIDLLLNPPHLGIERRHTHHLPALEPGIGLGAAEVDPHLAGADQLLQMSKRHLRKMRAEPAVEPHAIFITRHDLLADPAHACPRITMSPT